MEEMVEPDRTIMIVSIIGLVIIWGSVLYHKFVQGGGPSPEAPAQPGSGPEAEAAEPSVPAPAAAQKKRRKKG